MNIFKALFLMILAASFAYSQNSIILSQNNWTSVIFTDIVESSGQKFELYVEDNGENIGVEGKTFLFNRERLINFEFCSESRETGKKVQAQYRADRFNTYEIKGKVFAYEFPNLMVPLIPRTTKSSLKETANGCVDIGRSFVFMDEDGDGTFEQSCDRKALTPLPQWVVDLGQIKVRTSAKN